MVAVAGFLSEASLAAADTMAVVLVAEAIMEEALVAAEASLAVEVALAAAEPVGSFKN